MTPPGQRGRYAIIPTHNRIDEVTRLVVEMTQQVDTVMVIDNASDPRVRVEDLTYARDSALVPDATGKIWSWYDEEQPPNLARLWNDGLSACATMAKREGYTEWDVAILNDDVQPYAGWFARCAEAMRAAGAAAACTGPRPVLKTEPDADLGGRMYGPAFVIRGELAASLDGPLRADERLKWWFQDTDLDWRARRNGGMLVVVGDHVPHLYPNRSTVTVPELGEQAGRDRETFREIHGWCPW